MATDQFEFRVSFKRLLIGMLLTVVPICLVALYAITQTDSELQRTIGTHFKIAAGATAYTVSQFIHDRVVDVRTMATEPSVLNVITAANRTYPRMSEDAITSRMKISCVRGASPLVAL